jgi:hypothetical protein
MRSTNSEYQIGDIVPLKTSMGNVVWSKLIDTNWPCRFATNQTTNLYDEKAIIVYLDEVEFRRKNKLDCIGLNCGQERAGKSMFVYSKKKIFESPNYVNKDKLKDILSTDNWDIHSAFTGNFNCNLSDINFTLENFKKSLKQTIEGYRNMISLDEAGVGLSSLKWHDQEQINLYIEFQVIGKKQIYAELVLPHLKDLNNRFRDRRVAFLANISFIRDDNQHTFNRGYVDIRQGIPSFWELDTYWDNFLVCKFPDLSEEDDWFKYEKIKDEFIQTMVIQQEIEQEFSHLTKKEYKYYNESCAIIQELMNPTIIKSNIGLNNSQIAGFIGCTPSALTQRIQRYNYTKSIMYEVKLRKEKESEELCQLKD